MRILIDIGHPAHVHYFKNFIWLMQNKGHSFFITARDKEMTHNLLEEYGFDYVSRGNGGKSLFGKLLYLLKADLFVYNKARKFKPDLFLSFSSPYAAHASSLYGRPHISMDDTEHAKFELLVYPPFTEVLLNPDSFRKNLGKKQIRFNGYMELCYLHPNYFKSDLSIFEVLNIKRGEKYIIIRFVSWNATHDIGHSGLGLEMKLKAVNELSKFGKVFISSEAQLPNELKEYQINIPYEMMHSALANAALLYGESATMASECACLGTPAIFNDNNSRGYTEEQEQKYGLVYNFTESLDDQQKSLIKALELLKSENLKSIFQDKTNKMVADKIDVTAFLVWFIEDYPKSAKIMRENPGYQNRFK